MTAAYSTTCVLPPCPGFLYSFSFMKTTRLKQTFVWIALCLACVVPAAILAQQRGPAAPAGPYSRLPDGKPDMQGYWGSPFAGAAAWDVEDHPESFQVPAGQGAIIDPPNRKIPYQPWGIERRKQFIAHPYEDPQAHCFLSGVPRQMYTPFGFQILQPPGAPYVLILYESHHAYRIIHLEGKHPSASIKLWNGDSRGRWEGDTLVVDVTNQNGRTWLDMAGNFTTPSLHVVERFTPVDANTINYEATLEDPTLYTRPWKMGFPIRRNTQPGFEQLEFACHEGERDLQHYTEDTKLKK
jgi:hypothetical protein